MAWFEFSHTGPNKEKKKTTRQNILSTRRRITLCQRNFMCTKSNNRFARESLQKYHKNPIERKAEEKEYNIIHHWHFIIWSHFQVFNQIIYTMLQTLFQSEVVVMLHNTFLPQNFLFTLIREGGGGDLLKDENEMCVTENGCAINLLAKFHRIPDNFQESRLISHETVHKI